MKTEIEYSGSRRRQIFICGCKDAKHAFELSSEDDEPWVCLGLNWPDCTAHLKETLKALWHLLRGHYRFGDFLLPNEDIDAFCQFLQNSKKRFNEGKEGEQTEEEER